MKQFNSYTQIFVGLLLLTLFLLPSIVNLHHNFFEHRDVSCTAGIVNHVHETELHCDFGDFTWNTQYVEVDVLSAILFSAQYDVTLERYTQPGSTNTFSDPFRRGPPQFS